MNSTPLSPGFFTTFAWETFDHFKDIGIGLVVLLTIFALIVELVSVYQGGGMEAGAILVRAATAIFLLSCFHGIVEGAKDFVWAIEKVVSERGSIEETLSRFREVSERGAFWQGRMGGIQLMFAGWGLTAAAWFGELIFWLYGVLWLGVIIAAPLLIPTVIMEATQKIFRLFLFFILALLFVRVPWAMVSAVIGHLVDYLSEHGKGEELRSFFLFWIALIVTAVTPIVSTSAFLKMDGIIRSLVQVARGGLQGAGHAVRAVASGGASAAGTAAWAAHKYAHIAHGKELITGELATAMEKRFGSYQKPAKYGEKEFQARLESRLKNKPT